MRHEMKYIIPYRDYLIFKSRLDHLLKRDGHCQDKPYTITSLYYDDIYNKALSEKIEGDEVRHKYRLRYYDDDLSKVKLERKSKVQQMTDKEAVWLDSTESSALKETFDFLTKDGVLRPASVVRYERMAYIHTLGDLRVTFDLNIRGVTKNPRLDAEGHEFVSLMSSNEVIMEVKFNGILPSFISKLLETGHQMATSSSKYVFSRLPMYV